MTFESPEFFLLLPALVLIGWVWRGLRLWQPLRAAILVVGTLALTGPEIRRQRDTLDLLVLLDRSESTEDLIDRGLPEWRRLLERARPSGHDRIRYFNFATEVAEEGIDGSYFTGNRARTRTALALETLVAMAEEDRPTRILLFTDGHATEPLAEAAGRLEARSIPLDFRLVREAAEDDFRVAGFSLPERVQAGEPFLVTVRLRGPREGTFPLHLKRGGRLLAEREVSLVDGMGTVEFTDRIGSAGSHFYEVSIHPEEDAHTGNNVASRWIEVTGGPRLLLVSRHPDDQLAGEPASLHAGRLSGARAVILNNVAAHDLAPGFMAALPFFVRDQGGGLLMAGGERSFGAGGYFQSALDEVLPVSMELKTEHRKLTVALAIVMDRSGSMSVGVDGGLTKMDLANNGAVNAIQLLGNLDQVTVIPVDTQPTLTVPLSMVGGARNEIIGRVRRIDSRGGGIFVYTGLRAAWAELEKSPAGTRHVILFSDANDSEEPGNYIDLIDEMLDGGCTISVIGLGTPADRHADFLEDIARRGGGRLFFTERAQDVPTIFAQETVTVARSAFVKEEVAVLASGRWAEISPQALAWPGQVDGYNLSYARPDATVSLLSADEYGAPLVAHARRGLGRSMAVSFPLSGEYSESVRAWQGYGDFVQTAARFLMGDELPPGMALRHRLDGTQLTLDLLYDTEQWAELLALAPPRLRVAEGTDGTVREPDWERIQPGRFSVALDLEPGVLTRGAVQVGEHSLPFGPVAAGSTLEWAFDPARVSELRAAARQSGGRELVDLSTAWVRPPLIASTPLALPLGVLLLLLMLADALVTRTGWKLPEWRAAGRGREKKRAAAPVSRKVARRRKAALARENASPAPETTPAVPAAAAPPEPEPTEERRSRFQRAKERR